MTKEEVIQNAKDAIKKAYPNAEFIDKGNFTPTPFYYDTFDDSIVERVFELASFGICVRKNEAIESPATTTSNAPFEAIIADQNNKIADLEVRLKKADSDYMDKVHLSCVRGKEIARLNKVIHEKNVMIKNLISERGRVARLLAAEQTTHKIDLQATTSAESALIYKEKEYEKSLQEKDEVIDDLSRELAHSKEREEELIATVKDYLKEIGELKSKRRDKDSAMEGRKKRPFDTPISASKQADGVIFYLGSPRLNMIDELIRLGLWQ